MRLGRVGVTEDCGQRQHAGEQSAHVVIALWVLEFVGLGDQGGGVAVRGQFVAQHERTHAHGNTV